MASPEVTETDAPAPVTFAENERQVQIARNALDEAGHPDWTVSSAVSPVSGELTISIGIRPKLRQLAGDAGDLRDVWRAWFLAGVGKTCLPCWLEDRAPFCDHEVVWA